ncbi:HET domain-containing protein [Trichoderma velutinum]
MEEPVPTIITTQPGTYLCQYCQNCVRSCGVKYPKWLGSDRYMDGLRQVSALERRSKYAHSNYESFLAAVDQGCFICKTLFEDMSEDMVSELRNTVAGSMGNRVSSFDLTYMKSPVFACRLNFAILLPPQLKAQADKVDRNFILQGFDPSSTLSVKYLSAGKTKSNIKPFVIDALKTCIKNHALCSNKSAQPMASARWYPTRLIDVGTPESDRSNVELIETAGSFPRGSYVTLSHCWGDAATVFKLQIANKKSLLKELPPLAKTFEEAIDTTKELGARYIWIDCICIIQDDKADWEREASLMANVYRNAMCNISATASSDSTGGLYYDREDLFTGISLSYPEDREELLLVREELEVTGDVEFAAITKRGWVLQERLLSPRIIHFTSRQLIWECNELIASENFPDGLPEFWTYYYVPKRLMADVNETLSTEELVDAWGDVLERYTNASLTFQSDLLPALSGIAKYLQEISGATYLTGIWNTQEKPVINLAWECEPNLHRPANYRAPSWSWASTDNPVTFKPFKSTSDSHEDGWFGSANTKAEFIDAQVTAATSDLTGPASSAILTLEGPLNEIIIKPGLEAFLNEENLEMMISFDEPESEEGSFFILPLYSYYSEHDHIDGIDQMVYVYLLLSQAKHQPGCYTRCGLGRIARFVYERPPIWDKVVNGINAVCDEFLGLERGHRIQII